MELNRDTLVAWVVYPAALAVLFGCTVFSLVRLIALLNPAWATPFLVPVCCLATAEAYWSGRALARLPVGSPITRWHVRAVELGAWFLVLDILDDVRHAHGPVDSGTLFITDAALVQFTLLVLCWIAASNTSLDLHKLDEVVLNNTSSTPVERLTARFFRGGGLLLLFTGLTTVHQNDLEHVTNLFRPTVSGIIYNVLLYFAVGCAMLGQIRYEHLRLSWNRRGMTITAGISLRWLRYSLALLAVGAVIALLLPTDYTRGVLDLVRGVEDIIAFIVGLIELLILLPLAWLFRLIPFASTHALPAPHHLFHPPPAAPHHQAGHSNVLTVIRSIVFWLVLGAAAVYLVRTYAHLLPRKGPGRLTRMLWRGIRGMWRSFWKRLLASGGAVRLVLRRAPRPVSPREATPPQRRRTLFPWLLPPRDQIIWYYAGLIQRATRSGHPRTVGQTPYEYRDSLAPHLPSANHNAEAPRAKPTHDATDLPIETAVLSLSSRAQGDSSGSEVPRLSDLSHSSATDLDLLTQAYVEARYAPTTVTPQQAHTARTIFRRLISAVRKAR
jgi:hypothetical protein